MRLLSRHILIVLAIAFAMAIGVLLVAPSVSIARMPAALRYAPSDSTNIIYAPELGPIWDRFGEHGELIARLDEAGADTVDAITSVLQSTGALAGLLVNNPNGVTVDRESLEAAGVDFSAPFMVAFRGPIAAGDFVALIPVDNPVNFQAAIAAGVAETVEARALQPIDVRGFEPFEEGGVADMFVQLDATSSSTAAGVLVDNGQAAFPRVQVYRRDRLCSDALRGGVIPGDAENVIAVRSAADGPQAPVRTRALDVQGRPLHTRAEVTGDIEPSPQEQLPALNATALSARIAVAGRTLEIRLAGANACYAMLGDGQAIVFSRLETLEETLRGGGAKESLAAQRLFTRGLRVTAPRSVPLLGWVYLRQADPNISAFSPMIASLGGDDAQISLRLWSAPLEFYSQRVRSLVGPSGLSDAGAHTVIGSGGFASLNSGDLAELLQFADSVVGGGLDEALWQGSEEGPFARYRPVVRALIDTPNVTRLSISVVGVRERVPQLVLRATLPHVDADALVLDIQRSQQRARDRALLARAARQYGQPLPENGWSGGANGRQLQVSGLLAAETGTEDGWRRAFSLQPPESFATSEYSGCVSGVSQTCAQTAVFLFPPFTANDEVLLGSDLTDRDEVIRRLREGRYRVASTYRDGVIWLAPDLEVLRDALDAEPRREAAAPTDATERRLHISIDPRWLNSQRRLDGIAEDTQAAEAPEGEYYEGEPDDGGIDGFIRQFSIYESVELTFDVLSNDNGFVIDICARR